MAKKKFSFGLRMAATADVTSLIDIDEQSGADTLWASLGPGMFFSGLELKKDYGISWIAGKNKAAIYWRKLSGAVVRIADNWAAFRRRTRVELESHNLSNMVRERRIAQRVVALRVAVVVGAIVYTAFTEDIQGGIAIVRLGNRLADSLEDGSLSIQDVAGLIQAAGKEMDIDIEAELKEQLSAAGVSDQEWDELIGPYLDDVEEFEKSNITLGNGGDHGPPASGGLQPVYVDITPQLPTTHHPGINNPSATPRPATTSLATTSPRPNPDGEDDGIGLFGVLTAAAPLGLALLASLLF